MNFSDAAVSCGGAVRLSIAVVEPSLESECS